MRFKKVYEFELMKVGKTQNGLEIDEGIIEESVIHRTFDGAPIIYNECQNFKDYRNNEDVDQFIKEKVVGVVIPGSVDFNSYSVTADVMLLEEFANRTHYDNWCIDYDKDKCWFNYSHCELFSMEEIDD